MNSRKANKVGNKKLKPCPFCGGKASIYTYIPDKTVAIRCDRCGATIYSSAASDLEEVIIRKWNHRQAITEILNVCDEFNKSGARFNFLEYNDITEPLVMLDTMEKIEEIARQ